MLAATISYPDFTSGVEKSPCIVLANTLIGDHHAPKNLINESINQLRENPELAYEILCSSVLQLIEHPETNCKPSETVKLLHGLVSRSMGVMEKYQQSNLRA